MFPTSPPHPPAKSFNELVHNAAPRDSGEIKALSFAATFLLRVQHVSDYFVQTTQMLASQTLKEKRDTMM